MACELGALVDFIVPFIVLERPMRAVCTFSLICNTSLHSDDVTLSRFKRARVSKCAYAVEESTSDGSARIFGGY